MNLYIGLINLIRTTFWLYSLLILGRVVLSWFPQVERYPVVKFLFSLVDPYLNFFRRFIPPIGGMIDLSPIVAFFALSILEKIILWILI
jgi:YggT family protein